jgi:CHAT domain-containing protein
MQLHKLNPSQRIDSVALETSERARARCLLELLGEARANIREGVDAGLLARERELAELINAKAERQFQLAMSKQISDEAAIVAREMESLLAGYQELQAQIRARSPRYAVLTQPEPTTVAEIQRLLDADTLLLQFSLGEQRSYMWLVSSKSIASYELPNRAEIEEAARRFYHLLRNPDQSTEPKALEESAQHLSRMLLSPAASLLGSKRLLIVPDGALHYVPFAALATPSHIEAANCPPLIVNHEIVVLPSASVLEQIRRELSQRKRPQRAVAVLADPVFSRDDPRLRSNTLPNELSSAPVSDLQRAMADVGLAGNLSRFPRLPFSRREAEAIAGSVPQTQSMKALDFRASRDTATNGELSNYRIVHFATHGLLNNTHAELSGIVLSLIDSEGQPQDGFLRLHEIYNLRLPADLVVLSACQTGLGKEIRGEGLVGLTRGFMYAGAARVAASLWKVDDAATAELMKRFYLGMLMQGLPPAAALRKAQVGMWRQERWRSPYYWAAFVLQGEWK